MTGPYITERGGRTADELFGEGGQAYMERHAEELAQRVDEDWAHIHNDYVMNGMYSRGVLSTAVRELCAVAALTALGHPEELEPHIRFALRSNPPEHVREVILQMSVYGGVPVALNGMRIFDKVAASMPGTSEA
jgi:alkylhydroperoxidase/carboxymuconolactone decarboxylase family protein YurZ